MLFSNNRSAQVSVNFIMDLFQQVLQMSRVGGRNIKDCVHKVLDRYLKHFLQVHNQMHCEIIDQQEISKGMKGGPP